MTEEQIREKIAKALWLYDREHHLTPCEGYSFHPVALPEMALSLDMNSFHYGKLANQILSIKVGSLTLKELIELYEQGELLEKADNQDLPENPYPSQRWKQSLSYNEAQQDMLKEGWVKCKVKEE